MAYTVNGSDFESFLKHAISGVTDKSAIQYGDYELPHGKIHFAEDIVNAEMYILQSQYFMDQDVCIQGKGDDALLEIQFNLSNRDISFVGADGRAQVSTAKSANIAFLAPEDNRAAIYFQKNTLFETFDIHIPTTVLSKYAGESPKLDSFLQEIQQIRSSKLSSDGIPTTTAMRQVIQQMQRCLFDGLTRKIYLESKVYELIALLHDGADSPTYPISLTPADTNRIHAAANLIQTHLEHPLTIVELAKQVGINQTKLKEGFKMVYQHTIFGYLQQLRMDKAMCYLQDTQLSIQQIANLLGYQNMSNFSAAFKKTKGISPLKLRLSYKNIKM